MSRRALPLLLGLCVALGAAGCDFLSKERKRVENLLASGEAPATPSLAPPPSPTPAPATTMAGATSLSDERVPTPEDFEQQAAREITAANLQAELDRLSKAIGP